MSPADKLEKAQGLKASGAEAFKAGEWAAAQSHYREASGLLDGFAAPELRFNAREEAEQQARTVLVACWLNEAMCALKLEEFTAAEEACRRAAALPAAPRRARVHAPRRVRRRTFVERGW